MIQMKIKTTKEEFLKLDIQLSSLGYSIECTKFEDANNLVEVELLLFNKGCESHENVF